MKNKVVQLVAFKSVYNDYLQENLKKNPDFAGDFDLIDINIEDDMMEFENAKGFKRFKDISNINRLIYFYYFNKYLILKYNYLKGSILHIQSVSAKYAFLLCFFKKVFSKIIVTFWGSDLLRAEDNKKVLLRVISHFSNIITFETKAFSELFKKQISNNYNSKIRIVDFGIQMLNDIDDVKCFDIASFKKQYGICLESKVIAIGYSRIAEHQHVKVINSLIHSNVNKEGIFIVFPWTYGEEHRGYRDQIEDSIKGKFDYVFIDNNLTNKDMAVLRCVTDILVNVETTDVMSFSMLETLYAKNIVITGSWLPYDDIYNEGVYMARVDSVDEVGNKIKYLLNNSVDTRVVDQNKKIIGKLYRWDNCINKWIDLYK